MQLDRKPLVSHIRALADKRQMAFDIHELGLFVASLLSHPQLGKVSTAEIRKYDRILAKNPFERKRILATNAFMTEALTSCSIRNKSQARLLADLLHGHADAFEKQISKKIGVRKREERESALVDAFIVGAGGPKKALALLQRFRQTYSSTPLGAIKEIEEMGGDQILLGDNSELIIRSKGLLPDRSYVKHHWISSIQRIPAFAERSSWILEDVLKNKKS